jgi:HSP20 family protein
MDFRVDIVDDPSSSRVVATFELPGVRNNEVTMHLHDGKLYIHGERRPRIVSEKLGDQAGSPQPFSGTSDELASNAMEVDTSPPKIALPIQELKYGKFQRTLPVHSSLKVGLFERK